MSLCIDCSVLACYKEKDGYWAIGSTINQKPFKCPRTKRCFTWKEAKTAKACVDTGCIAKLIKEIQSYKYTKRISK